MQINVPALNLLCFAFQDMIKTYKNTQLMVVIEQYNSETRRLNADW